MIIIPEIGDTVFNVGELRTFLNTLDDHDQVVIEATDENGDVEDLYSFHMDVIENIELTDGTIIREVRFCQNR